MGNGPIWMSVDTPPQSIVFHQGANFQSYRFFGDAIFQLILLTIGAPRRTVSNKVLALVALTGIPFAALIVWYIVSYFPKSETSPTTGEPEHSWTIKTVAGGCIGALTGLIGIAILRRSALNLEGLSIWYASWACGLGGLALGGITLIIFYVALRFIFSPILCAMSHGLEFMFQRAIERRGENGSYQYAALSILGSQNVGSEIYQEISRRDCEGP